MCRGGKSILAGTTILIASGCLSLGGRTTYVNESPEMQARIQGLETRVTALEQAFATRSAAPLKYEPDGEEILSQGEVPRTASEYTDDDAEGSTRR